MLQGYNNMHLTAVVFGITNIVFHTHGMSEKTILLSVQTTFILVQTTFSINYYISRTSNEPNCLKESEEA